MAMTDTKTGVLLANLGTPEAPTAEAVKPYLAEFLMDPNVVSIPKWLWWPILHGIILRRRPAKSAEAYQKIWLDEGSPLLVYSQQIKDQVQARLKKNEATQDWPVALGMTYGQPSMQSALEALKECDRIIVLPLYPQYSSASTASVEWRLKQCLEETQNKAKIEIINNYYNHPQYITAIADSVHRHWHQYGHQDRLLISFHGMPERTRKAGDPYYSQCEQTATLLAQELDLEPHQWAMSFQSRFGREAWLMPYTSDVLNRWAKDRCTVSVVCPGFAADCLETLEEIDMQYREQFIKAGGKRFYYIPALNAGLLHIKCLVNLIHEQVDLTG